MRDSDTSQDVQALLALTLLSIGKLLAFGVCFATGGAGGLLMPSLVIGTTLGRCAGLAIESLDSALPSAGAVLGMAAFFSANMRLPLTAAGVALECATATSSYDARLVCTIPLASALGTWVAAWWDQCSIFERMMMQDGINPFTLSQQIRTMLHGHDGQGPTSRERPPRQRRDSGASLLPGPLAPPALAPDGARYGESQGSARMVMAARRRSILAEFRVEPSAVCASTSFISSPDEFLFASSIHRVHPRQSRHLGVLPAEELRRSSAPYSVQEERSDGRGSDTLSWSLFPGVESRRSSRASSSTVSQGGEAHSRRSSVQERSRPSGCMTPAVNVRLVLHHEVLQPRSDESASGSTRTGNPDAATQSHGLQMPHPTLLGYSQVGPKGSVHHQVMSAGAESHE
mmetsp:Transcript_72279/g.211821  ORF Transcript_72279/g.211821 Transcript_72279/m.211821 type:complete len:401 (-) Transcript_72279:340-1542(-)